MNGFELIDNCSYFRLIFVKNNLKTKTASFCVKRWEVKFSFLLFLHLIFWWMQNHFLFLRHIVKKVKRIFQNNTFAIRFLYGRCSSLRFRWATCPTVSKAEGTIISFGSMASNICNNIQDLIYPLIWQTKSNFRVSNPHNKWVVKPN